MRRRDGALDQIAGWVRRASRQRLPPTALVRFWQAVCAPPAADDASAAAQNERAVFVPHDLMLSLSPKRAVGYRSAAEQRPMLSPPRQQRRIVWNLHRSKKQ